MYVCMRVLLHKVKTQTPKLTKARAQLDTVANACNPSPSTQEAKAGGL